MKAIYRIYNLINDFCYIGSTKNYNNRVAGHKFDLKRGKANRNLSKFVKEHGLDKIVFEVLEEIYKDEDLKIREDFWMKKYKNLWNVAPEPYTNKGSTMPESHKRKTSKRMKGNTITKNKKMPESHGKNIKKYWEENPDKLEKMKQKNRESQLKIDKSGWKTYKLIDVYKDEKLIDTVKSLKEVCKKYNLTHSCASKVLQGKQKITKGYFLVDKGYCFEK